MRKWSLLGLVAASAVVISPSLSAAGMGTPSESFTVTQPTMVPGLTLQPGTYSIAVMSETDGRYIMRVDGQGGSPHAIFVAVPLTSLPRPGALTWEKGPEGSSALRGFAFRRGGQAVEFAYPKDDAVSLAKINHAKVLAVDPASEGRSPELSSLTNDEIQAVTLWTLTPEAVSGETGAETKIAAARYSVGEQIVPSGKKPLEQAAAVQSKTGLKRLPHTASEAPLLLLLGVLAAVGGAAFTIRRTRVLQQS